MYKDNCFIDACKLPEDNTLIWRYMDFAKFISLIDKRELFFTRADRFEDPFEGSFPKKCTSNNLTTDKSLANHIKLTSMNFRKHAHINCWHENKYESEAMWKLYSQSDRGIAVCSTIGRLKSCIKDARNVYIGKVKYIDYREDVIYVGDFFSPFFHKRKSFSHEQEIRAFVETTDDIPVENGEQDYSKDVYPFGIGIKIDPNILIDKIFISPYTQSWFFELVCSVTKRYGYNFFIHKSELNESPMF